MSCHVSVAYVLIVTAIWFVEVLVSMSGLVLDTGLAQKLTFFGKAYMMTG